MKIFKHLNKEDRIYLAGLFDDEGCIQITSYMQKNRINYTLKASIGLTTKFIIYELIKKLNGNNFCVKSKNPRHKDYYIWWVTGHRCIHFLNQIYPYLRIKKKQSEIAFKFGKTYKRKNLGLKVGLTKKEIKYRNYLWNEMRKLNIKRKDKVK